jgi:hypothetical protein
MAVPESTADVAATHAAAEVTSTHAAATEVAATHAAAKVAAAHAATAEVAATTAPAVTASPAASTTCKRIGCDAGASNRQRGNDDRDFVQRKFPHGASFPIETTSATARTPVAVRRSIEVAHYKYSPSWQAFARSCGNFLPLAVIGAGPRGRCFATIAARSR